ncbi:MAG: prepilin-type N-terminal cleavage/methylation domain-containing protein [Planctomycetes bacterium]|nr:prepilin-type N-terminal cleavage/methylation domain-containing protein [Planctomycetota bacterium]
MPRAPHGTRPERRSRAAGFSLIEVLVAVALIGLGLALVAPNLGALIPSARLDGSGKEILTWLQTIRSEARIQAKRMEMEFDLDKRRYRIIWPPEEQLTSDQVVYDDTQIADRDKDWIDLQTDVTFAGCGDAAKGLAEKGKYRVVFDEYGFTADQVIALRLESEPEFVWSLSIRGLTGKIETFKSEDGELIEPERVEEGAF